MTSDLYPGLLGHAWASLHEVVRRLHSGGSRSAVGVFEVRHGWSARAGLGRVMGLPAAGGSVGTRLAVAAEGECERWQRRFGERELVTLQRASPDGELLESFGPLELRLRMRAEDGALIFEPLGAGLRLGARALGLPRWLSPRIAGRVAAEGAAARVEIEVRAPLLGLLIAYSGTVTPA